MDNRTRAWLYDILSAIQESNTFLEDEDRNQKNYPVNFCIKKALERNMEIVGLSLKNILNYLPSLNISNSEKIIDICQRLANVDDPVSEEIMKVALFEYFPKLKDDIHLMIIQSS
jgi:uncharacterized protein with HEPN domain